MAAETNYNPFEHNENGASEWDILRTEQFAVDSDIAPFHTQEEEIGAFIDKDRSEQEARTRQKLKDEERRYLLDFHPED
jgi:hypothetical protein